MTIWKKAVSSLATASLLASLLATAVAPTVGAFSNTTTYLGTPTPSSGSVAADGISTIVVPGAGTIPASTDLYIAITGASFISAGGVFTLQPSGAITTSGAGGHVMVAADQFTVRAPSAVGSATISVYTLPTGGGNATLDGTMVLDFYASSALGVSVANSSVLVTSASDTTCGSAALASNSADKGTNPAAKLCVTVKDGNGTAITNATVAVTITPVGLVAAGTVAAAAPAGTAQAASTGTNASGVYAFGIGGSSLAGVATIGISVTDAAGNTTAFAPVTFTFTGAVASVTATAVHTAIATGGSSTGAVKFITKDAAGNQVASGAATVVTTGTVFTAPTNGAAVTTPSTASAAGTVDVTCGSTAGSGTIAVKANGITSNAVTIYCSGPADTYSVAFDKTTVAPGGTATITVTVKDAGGRPAPDGLSVSVVVSSGALLDTNAVPGKIANGVATWTFLAPFNTGVVTVLASATVATSPSPQSASINVSTPVSVTSGSAASALGVTTSGPFSTTTKVAAIGKYVTVKLSFGSGAAGQTVEILTATKSSSGVWSAFTTKTTRVANSNGDVYFYWKSSSAAWLSIRGKLTTAYTNAVQVRWM